MNFDDLLPILLIAFFVVNAFLRGGRGRRGRGASPQRRPPAAPPGPTSGRDASAPADAGESAPPVRADDELSRRLEEARRRVREAMEGGTSDRPTGGDTSSRPASSTASSPASSTASTSAGSSSSPSVQRAPTSASTGSGSVGPSAPAVPRSAPAPLPAFLGREGASPPRTSSGPSSSSGFLGREGPPPRTPRRVAPARQKTDASARMPAAVWIGTDPDDLVRGVVWSEVLGPPVALRPRRRTVSRRR